MSLRRAIFMDQVKVLIYDIVHDDVAAALRLWIDMQSHVPHVPEQFDAIISVIRRGLLAGRVDNQRCDMLIALLQHIDHALGA